MATKKEKTLREHLSAAGKVKSEKKAKASRDNGKKGGRPKTVDGIKVELKDAMKHLPPAEF